LRTGPRRAVASRLTPLAATRGLTPLTPALLSPRIGRLLAWLTTLLERWSLLAGLLWPLLTGALLRGLLLTGLLPAALLRPLLAGLLRPLLALSRLLRPLLTGLLGILLTGLRLLGPLLTLAGLLRPLLTLAGLLGPLLPLARLLRPLLTRLLRPLLTGLRLLGLRARLSLGRLSRLVRRAHDSYAPSPTGHFPGRAPVTTGRAHSPDPSAF
jgi:hypothetical protein